MKPETLAAALVRHGLLDAAAVHDPEGYDNGDALSRVKAAAAELSASEQPSPRAESADKQQKVDCGQAHLVYLRNLEFARGLFARTLPSCDACRHWYVEDGGWCSLHARRKDAVDECDKFKAREP